MKKINKIWANTFFACLKITSNSYLEISSGLSFSGILVKECSINNFKSYLKKINIRYGQLIKNKYYYYWL
jgi:hypothetical protein